MGCDVKNGVKLETFSNIDMCLFIEERLRGRISNVCNRHSKVNNKYMKNYEPTKPSKYISHLDMNNLYSWGMSQYLFMVI